MKALKWIAITLLVIALLLVGGVLICMVIGFAVVFILERVGQKRADV